MTAFIAKGRASYHQDQGQLNFLNSTQLNCAGGRYEGYMHLYDTSGEAARVAGRARVPRARGKGERRDPVG